MASPFATSILITGGAGYLGRGILRYIKDNKIPAKVTVYSRDEAKHYKLLSMYPNVRCVLGDVRDQERLYAAMLGHDVVIHAAALKHIPEAERDVTEAIAVNVDGSRQVGWAALRAGVRQVIGISTDKVCAPENTYGATKMLMERMFQELARVGGTRFNCVRYGNVISSTGSVVPLFSDQFDRDGKLTITSEAMTRFWFGVNEAVRLIETALTPEGMNGSTYVGLCAGMNILDVAKAVLAYKGVPNYYNAPYEVVGLRPGEKFHETLLSPTESVYAVPVPANHCYTRDTPVVYVPPALEQRGAMSRSFDEYTSQSPRKGMSIESFVQMIEDAALV